MARDGMKSGATRELWKPLKHAGAPSGPLKKDMDANAGLEADLGGITAKTGGPTLSDKSSSATYKKMAPTIKGVQNTESKNPVSKSDAPNFKAGEMGTGKEKVSKMAQKVGKPRKGF